MCMHASNTHTHNQHRKQFNEIVSYVINGLSANTFYTQRHVSFYLLFFYMQSSLYISSIDCVIFLIKNWYPHTHTAYPYLNVRASHKHETHVKKPYSMLIVNKSPFKNWVSFYKRKKVLFFRFNKPQSTHILHNYVQKSVSTAAGK